MSVQLDNSYSVVCHRGETDQFVRAIYLTAVASEPGVFKSFALYFIEQDGSELGRGYVNPDNGYVVPLLPARDFDPMYRILQTERTVYANWYADGDNKLVWFQVTASQVAPSGEPAEVPLSL